MCIYIYATCDTVDTLLIIMTCTVQVTPVMADTVTPAEPFPPHTRFLQQLILWHLSLVAMVMSSSRWCGSIRHNWTGSDTCRYACSLFRRLNVIRDGLNGTALQPNELIQLIWWEIKVRCDIISHCVFQGMTFNGRFLILFYFSPPFWKIPYIFQTGMEIVRNLKQTEIFTE